MRPWFAAAVLAALSLVGCGPTGGSGGPAVSPSPSPSVSPSGVPVVSPPAAALIAWEKFPADLIPRPIVLIANSSPSSFSSLEAKNAADCHKFRSTITLPKSVPNGAQVSWGNGTFSVYPAISAAAALAAMSLPPPAMPYPDCSMVQPLLVTAFRYGAFNFLTDRGIAMIYSWLFTATGANDEIAYPAITPTALWNGDLTKASSDRGTTISPDGRTLTFTFYGMPSSIGPCGADYSGVVAESRAAVAVAVQEIPHTAPTPGEPIACPAVAQQRMVTVTLASPLGGRVVVDADGAAVPVCPDAQRQGC
jgi:hypothetical protein